MTLRAQLCAILPGAQVHRVTPLHGGDLSEVSRAELCDGRVVVLKRGPLVAQETRMLRALHDAGAPTPQVLGQAGTLLVLDWMAPSPVDDASWRRCGAGLRAVHGCVADRYGWSEDYAFGHVSIPNTPLPNWTDFWAERRILPALPALPAALAHRVEAVARALPDLLPARPAPGLLHGDLWSGNIHFSGGTGVLIDPASYHGHGEVDLAMLDLFARLPAAFLDGYGPLDPGYEKRRPIYQIWPALVHVRLFGSGYLRMLDQCLREVGV